MSLSAGYALNLRASGSRQENGGQEDEWKHSLHLPALDVPVSSPVLGQQTGTNTAALEADIPQTETAEYAKYAEKGMAGVLALKSAWSAVPAQRHVDRKIADRKMKNLPDGIPRP